MPRSPMSKSYAEIPVGQFSEADIMSGNLPAIQAGLAQQFGPLFKRTIQSGGMAGMESVFMVGPEANRLVLHTRRDAFSHDRGWTPVIGELMGKGLLNMDNPEHDHHRKLWNPAFTNAYMETYIPLLARVIAAHTGRWVAQGTVDIADEARSITFDAAATALAGVAPSGQVERLQKLFYTLLFGAGVNREESYAAYYQKAMQARDELMQILLAVTTERRAEPADQ